MVTYKPLTIHADTVVVGTGSIVLLKPKEWEKGRFPLIEYIDVGERLKRGDWLIVLYKRSCQECRRLLGSWSDTGIQRTNVAERLKVAVIEVPETVTNCPAGIQMKDDWVVGRLDDCCDWFVSTPTVFRLEDGIVTKVYDKEIKK